MLIWGGYPRISEDPNDERAGVSRQIKDIDSGVKARGGEIGADSWYTENNTSAYKKRKVRLTDPLGNEYIGYRVIRPKWHQALHDLRTGKINALMVWDLDRLARDPRDLEDAIEAVEHYGATIMSATASEIDLTTESGRMMARVFVIMANKSSADTARRVKRAHLANAEAGKPVGGYRPFGWQDDKRTLDPFEAPLMQEVIRQLLAGASLTSMVRHLTDQGVTTTAGKPWKGATLRQYLKNARLAGLRTYRREILHDEHGRPVEGQWEPLVSRDDWDRLQKIFEKPERRSRVPRRDARHYLLTGIVRCGVCNDVMYGNRYADDRHYYQCKGEKGPKHTMSISGVGTDRLVEALVLNKIASEALESSEAPEREFAGNAKIEELESTIAATLDELGKGRISPERIFGQVGRLEEELNALRAERDEWLTETTGPPVTQLTPDEWKAMDTDHKRGFVEKYLEAIYVKAAVKRQNRLDPDRLVPVWK